MDNLRRSVLKIFKKLHKTRLNVFDGDTKALTAARLKINDEFNKYKHVTEENAIKDLIKLGEEVEKEMRTLIIQAREVRPGVYEARITDDTLKLDNVMFDENAVLPKFGKSSCCKEQAREKDVKS